MMRALLKNDGVDDGYVIGTYPIVSGTSFNNYSTKFTVNIPSGLADEYPLIVGISDAEHATIETLRIQLLFKDDGLVYYMNSVGTIVSTGIPWVEDEEEEFIIYLKGMSTFLLRKEWRLTPVLQNKYDWEYGVMYFIAKTPSTTGIHVDNIGYAW